MYTNYNKKSSNSRFFFVAIAIIASIFVIAAIISSPTFFIKKIGPGSDTELPITTPEVPTASSPPETSSAADSTEELPFDTATESSVETTSPPPETTAPSSAASQDTVAPPDTSAHFTAADPEVNPCVLTETADAGQEYLDKIIFIGDSTTYSFLYYGKLTGGKDSLQVWTPASRTLTLDHATTTTILYPDTNEEITIQDAVSRKKPEILVITLGVNGISYMNEEYFKSAYTKLVDMIADASPDTQIILQSIFPVATNWEMTKSINNEKINNANAWIRDVSDSCEVRYLDTISVLAVDDGGYLPQTYQNGDGLHLSTTACDIVLNYIRTHALPGYAEE